MADQKPVKVTITYCAECGYEPQTLALTDALMRAFTHQLSSIELVPWYEGSFDVTVGESEPRVVAERSLTARELPLDGQEHALELPFELDRTEFGAQFRVHTFGRVRMSVQYPVEVE